MRADRFGSIERGLICAGGLCLALQFWLALVMEVNWDEFVYLAHIFEHQRGELSSAVRTFHVHLFGWLTRVPGNEISQVEAGRLVMLACEAATAALVYALSRGFASRAASLFASLAYVAAGYTMIHGASFRTDPLAAALTMTALATIARAPPTWPWALLAGLAAAVAALVTVKVIFYLPAFAAIAWWRRSQSADRRRGFLWLAATAAATVLAFAALYLLHLELLADARTGASGRQLARAGQATLMSGLAPRAAEIAVAGLYSPLTSVLLLVGLATAAARLGERANRARHLAILGCASPLLCLLFYRNAFPYFFPFIMPPAMVVAGWIVDQIPLLRRNLLALMVMVTAPAIVVALKSSERDQHVQVAVLGAVHAMFPQPVPVIDRNSMIASFPKRGFFMSTWGMKDYRARPPIFATILAREPVPLLVLNHGALATAVDNNSYTAQSRLHPEDEFVLRENYIPHWGIVWVAGKRLTVDTTGRSFAITIPGRYTLEGGSAIIDGRLVRDGALVSLERGEHSVRVAGAGMRTLRWGERLHRPPRSPPSGPIYRGF